MSSDSDDENVIRYGTPLEPYEEDEVPSKRKFQQPTDQYAVDAHGRRRFHGAFTGGFSAGFQNSVGSSEGWKPATFKSSRSDKAQTSSQRPEDFMDEEDRSEFGIAPRHMETQSEFSGRKRPRQKQFHDGPIPGVPVLEQLIETVHETAAVRMLRAMGWRPGQGAGERVTKKDKRQAKQQHKVYGCYMPNQMTQDKPDSSGESSDSEYEYETLFAPDDYEPYILQRKNDRFGLGYSGLSRHSVLGGLAGDGSTSHLLCKDKGKKVSIHGQAFGVGAFEAEDEDIYASTDMSQYDFAIGPPEQRQQTHKEQPKKDNQVLEGFARASLSAGVPLPAPRHPPPALPRDYVPARVDASRFEPAPAHTQPRDQGLGRHELTPQARGALLGEPAPKPQEAIVQPDTIQPRQTPIQTSPTDPIAKLLGRNVDFTSTAEPKELDYISIKDSGKEIPKVFKPFAGNLQKQRRYEKFVNDREGYMKERDGAIDRLSEWERNRELVEFEQAAKLYKPLTGEMGDRFTHASEPDEGATNPLFAVAKSQNSYGLASPAQIEAAARGVYGVMTRRAAPWRPEPLVCKRLNVPTPGLGAAPEKEERPKVSYSIFSYLESSVHDRESFAKEQTAFSGSKSLNTDVLQTKAVEKQPRPPKNIAPEASNTEINATTNKRMTVAELFLKESEMALQSNKSDVTETIEKFDKMDLYKSIFLSDSEEEEEPTKEKEVSIDFDKIFDVPKNIERNTSPPRGIFANIDFDELNSWKRNASNKTTVESSIGEKPAEKRDSNIPSTSKETGQDTLTEDIVYGPKIPETIQKRLENTQPVADNFRPIFKSKTQKGTEDVQEISSSSSDSWVDVNEVKSKKSKKKVKKNKKHKSKHKKSKHKKKSK